MSEKQNKNKKWTQAERQVHRWTGVRPDGKKAEDQPEDRKSRRAMMSILTKDAMHRANPEFAFGCVRRLLTGNVFKSEDFTEFINTHPAFRALTDKVFAGEATMEVDGDLLTEALASKWGHENKPNRTLEVRGEVEITWVDRDGVKTELVQLGYEMIRYETDSRPYIALNCGGGSAIRRFLIRSGPKPDYKINDDATARRWSVRGKSVEEAVEEQEAISEAEVDSLMDQLLSGETVTLGL